MALSCLPRFFSIDVKRCGFILAATPKFNLIQSASIVSKEWMDPNVKKPAPWPYEKKKFTFFHAYFSGTIKRFDDNTKIIVVEGNIGAGKSNFAKQLADAFDMKYIPEPDIVSWYKTYYGYDLRELDPIMPPSYKSYTLENFYRNPKHTSAAKMQFRMFMMRYEAYIDGLAHLLNTGQGLVMDRCAYSDFVFLEAMFKAGCFRKEVREFYYEICGLTLEELLHPHLIIYLDITPEVAMERIKQRNIPYEQNSPILNKSYLESIEYFYKQRYLKDFQKHSEILIYDWNHYGDVEVVVEDIERIDFDRFTQYDTQLKDWRKEDDWEWAHYRRWFTNWKPMLMNYPNIMKLQYHELYHPPEEYIEYKEIMDKVPGEKYRDGFNSNAGDSVWFKTKFKSYREEGGYRMGGN